MTQFNVRSPLGQIRCWKLCPKKQMKTTVSKLRVHSLMGLARSIFNRVFIQQYISKAYERRYNPTTHNHNDHQVPTTNFDLKCGFLHILCAKNIWTLQVTTWRVWRNPMVFIPTGLLVVSSRSLQSTAAGQVKGRKAGSLEHCSPRCAASPAQGLIVPHSFSSTKWTPYIPVVSLK